VKVAGITSTGSKRPSALFGGETGVPETMRRSRGARVWDADGREYLDFVMALGAVTLGYGDPEVTAAAAEALERGGVGPLPPIDEAAVAEVLGELVPWAESVRFLKTGAEAVAAAVRLARVATNRDRVLGCGYHGWLDLASPEPGVPRATRALYGELPFNDPAVSRELIQAIGDDLALVLVEPVIDGPPSREWLEVLREETEQVGAVLAFDEIKTGFRIAPGGAAERYGVVPDLAVYGKAMANGFPLAAVAGTDTFMGWIDRTWISSTLATEFVSLAAARAALVRTRDLGVPARLRVRGEGLLRGLRELADAHPRLVTAALGIEEMCYLRFREDPVGARAAAECARRGLLFKRNGYNFVSLAHSEDDVDRCLDTVGEVLAAIEEEPRC
jgi:glutamate-1-semialdehyde 2,1-aminomutase